MTTHRRTGSHRRGSLQVRSLAVAAIAAVALFAFLVIRTSWFLPLAWVAAWTPVAFALYGFDKLQARREHLRIPESSLLALAPAGGWLGALGGMFLFHHKTAKRKFWVVNLASAAAYAVLFVLWLR